MSEKPPTLSQKYTDVSDTLGSVSQMVNRIDARVEIFMEKIVNVEEKLDTHIETCPAKCSLTEILTRLGVMESKNGKALREELLQHIQDQKQAINKLTDKVETLEKTVAGIKNATDQQAKHWNWIGLFLFNAAFNVVALILAGYLLHLWKITP